MSEKISIERIKEVFDYNEETGSFTRKVRTGTRGAVGSVTKANHNKGYVMLSVDGSQPLAHRAAWAIYTGCWPEFEIDHIDGDRSNNRISNLREATHAENMQNRALQVNNTSGHPGVTYDSKKQRWRSEIYIGGKAKSQGRFRTIEEAIAANLEARSKLYHFQPVPRHLKAAA